MKLRTPFSRRTACLVVLTAFLLPPVARAEPRLLRIHGEVRAIESGNPLSSARLSLGRADRPGLEPRIVGKEVLSARSGRFELRVEVEHDGSVLHLCARCAGRADWTAAIRVGPGSPESVRIDVGMDPKRLAEGRVRDVAGVPVADAEVVLFRIPRDRPGPSEDSDFAPERHVARTNGEGKFRITGLGSGGYAYLVRSGGRGGAAGVWSTDPEPLEITLDPPRVARLVCRGGSERGFAKEIRVVLWTDDSWWCAEQTGRTGEVVEFVDLPEGSIEARAESEDGTLWLGACRSGARETTLPPGKGPRTHRLTFEVRAAGSGRPIPGAVVWCAGNCARADAQGLAYFQGLSPGPIEFSVYEETSDHPLDFEPVRFEVGDPPAKRRIAIDVTDRVVSIEGRVVGPDGEPVACAEVSFRRYDEPPWDHGEREGFRAAAVVPVDLDGTFGVVLPDASSWVRFVAHHPLHGWARSSVLHVSSARPGSSVELRLEGCVRLSGRLLDASGAPARGATIETRPLEAEWGVFRWLPGVENLVRSSCCDSEGRFQLHGVPSGPTSIHAALPDGARRTIGFLWADPASSPTMLELRMPKPRVLRGRIRDARGRPLSIGLDAATEAPLASERPDPERSYEQSTRSGADGRFRFEDIPGPVGTLRIRCPERGREFPPVRVESGDVELVLPD